MAPVAQTCSPVVQAEDTAEGGYAAKISDYWPIATVLTLSGASALWLFYLRNEILLSGDAVAHINIARRVFDSPTPGLLQLGSVWLPLPHLLTLPFVVSERMWQSGIGGSIVSVVSYVIAGVGLFRLLSPWSRTAAWIGTLAFAANPNLLYVQTTALNEPLYLASFIWAVVFFTEALRSLRRGQAAAGKSLEHGAVALMAAIFTRYDGWFLALLCWALLLPSVLRAISRMPKTDLSGFRKAVFRALLLTALGPALWMAYNFGVYGNALDFANGPYSARAIAQRTTAKNAPPYPGERSPWTAAVYYSKAAQLNLGEGTAGKLLLLLAGLASIVFALRREWLPIALLWSPLLFYSLSIAYGSVPIFIPVWWPFSYYNVRYGLELLPAIGSGIGLVLLMDQTIRPRWIKASRVLLLVAVAAISYAGGWQSAPVCLREVRINGHARMEFDRHLASALRSMPESSTVLAYTGAHSGAFELADFPLRQTISEGYFVVWDASLQHPATAADYVIASEGDPVADAISKHPGGLQVIATVTVEGQPRTLVYKTVSR